MRLIDADALVKDFLNHYRTNFEIKNNCLTNEDVLSIIQNAPTVEPEEVTKLKRENAALEQEMLYCRENWKKAERPQGEWIYKEYSYYCSNCNKSALDQEDYPYLSAYCPFCGAEMEVPND